MLTTSIIFGLPYSEILHTADLFIVPDRNELRKMIRYSQRFH